MHPSEDQLMFDIHTIKDIGFLRESCELECKKAGGRDGRGAVPESFWETYSAMANTDGGSSPDLAASSPDLAASSPLNGGSSPLNGGSSPLNGGSSPYKKAELLRDSQGRLISDYHQEPLIDSLEYLVPEKLREIEALAQLPREKQRISREQMRSVIMEICCGQYVTLGALAALVNRKPKPLQAQYLSPMVKEKQLKLAFPATPNDPRQAYITASTMPDALGKEEQSG